MATFEIGHRRECRQPKKFSNDQANTRRRLWYDLGVAKTECLVTYRRDGVLFGDRFSASSMLEAAAMCLEALEREGLPGPWPEVLEITVLASQKKLQAKVGAARKWRHRQVVKSPHPAGEPQCGKCYHGASWHSIRCEYPEPMLFDGRCMCGKFIEK
jgi:hypothetical protein